MVGRDPTILPAVATAGAGPCTLDVGVWPGACGGSPFGVHPCGGWRFVGRATIVGIAGRAAASALERELHFDEHTVGPYRIYAGALEAPGGDGYIAAVVVKRLEPNSHPGREAYRDESLACGHRWASPHEALLYAVARAREIIAKRSPMLSC